MTITKKQCTTKNYYIEQCQQEGLIFVRVCPLLNDSLASYPIQQAIYHRTEQEKANRTYKRYLKKYMEV